MDKFNFNDNFNYIYVFIIFIYFIIGILYLLDGCIPRNYIIILVFFILKMITEYDKCTISYIECKLRNVKKENGYLYDFLHSITMLRETSSAKYFYTCATVLIFLFIKQGSTA